MIPLSVPSIAGNEWKYVKDCLDTGWISSVGSYVTDFENEVARFSQTDFGVACVNGSAGLHVALQLCGVQQGDYVITPNITFIATVNAIKYCNAHPIFIDVDTDDWQMDLNLLENFLATETEGGCEEKYRISLAEEKRRRVFLLSLVAWKRREDGVDLGV